MARAGSALYAAEEDWTQTKPTSESAGVNGEEGGLGGTSKDDSNSPASSSSSSSLPPPPPPPPLRLLHIGGAESRQGWTIVNSQSTDEFMQVVTSTLLLQLFPIRVPGMGYGVCKQLRAQKGVHTINGNISSQTKIPFICKDETAP